MSFLKRLYNKLPPLGHFTSIPAAMIDRAYLAEPSGFLHQLWLHTKIRFIYAVVFLPLAFVDMVTSFAASVYHVVGSLFRTDGVQDGLLKRQKKFATFFSKNFYALLSAPIGLVNPKLVAFYFTPDRLVEKGVVSGGGYYRHESTLVIEPNTVNQVRRAITSAAKTGKKVVVVGAGRSQGKQFIPADKKNTLAIDLKHLDAIEINVKKKTATIGAGVRWSDVQIAANKHKLALQVMQASNVFSAGGSVGTNIHGWNIHAGVLSNTILSMDVVKPNGELVTVTPQDKLFHHVTGGLGLFGVVVSMTIQLTNNELLTEKGKEVALNDYPTYFMQQVITNPKIRMHLYRLSLEPNNLLATGVAVDYVKEGKQKPTHTPELTQEERYGTRTNRVLVNLARRFDLIRKWYWQGERKRVLGVNPPLTTNAIMQPPINAMFNPSVSEAEWLQEYFLPAETLPAFTRALGKLLMENKVVLLNASVRFVKQNPHSPFSYSHDGDRFAVVLCFNQSLQEKNVIKARKWLREAQELALQHRGAYYLPYQEVSTPEQFHRSYPHAAEAFEYKRELDPHNVLVTGFYKKYSPKPNVANYFQAIMRNEETKKQFAGFLEVVLQRVDTNKFYALLEDIMKYNDSHEEIYHELCRRLPEILPGAIGSLRRILNSLAVIKEDLAAQAKLLLGDVKEINGLVEIGYPGRFVGGFKKQYIVKGKVIAVDERQSLSDYIQTGFPRPYDEFQPFDYRHPHLSKLASASADVITCYVGLHHFPKDKLDAFLNDVRRVLRPGGHFLLVDHDIQDEVSLSMAYMAHMIFNAVTGASLQEEMTEIRNFQPMTHWRDRLAKAGLGYAVVGPDVQMIRKGDPSRNRMVCFEKPTVSPQRIALPELAVTQGEISQEQRQASPANGAWQKAVATSVSIAGSQGTFRRSRKMVASQTEGDRKLKRQYRF